MRSESSASTEISDGARQLILLKQPLAHLQERGRHLRTLVVVGVVRQDPAVLVGGGLKIAGDLFGLRRLERAVPLGGALLV